MKQALNKKAWVAIILFSLFGQVAWVVENMYFNVFIFQEFNASSSAIALMVSLSAITATLTTLFMGALSDKIGKRKVFICFGYILWGISIISFALLKQDILSNLFPYANAATLGVSLVILFDCIMTFFGSTANDASFNAWITDVTSTKNRGKVEGINASMPLLALLLVFGGFMGLTAQKEWSLIFTIIGTTVLFVGIGGFFFIKDQPLIKKEDSYFKNIFYGFRPSVVKKHSTLYLILGAFAVFGIAVQVFMPFLIIYFQYRLGLDDYVLIFAPAILLASVVAVLFGRWLDRVGFKKAIIPAYIVFVSGLLCLFFFHQTAFVFIGTLLMMCGNLGLGAAYGALIRDYTPADQVGMFQGLRMVAYVLLPMIIGPWIGDLVIQSSEVILIDGVENKIATKEVFLASAGVSILLLVLTVILIKKLRIKTASLSTPYTDNPEWNDYPRPQLVRTPYQILNGSWDMEIVQSAHLPNHFSQKIVVPYPLESALSGVQKTLKKNEFLVYRREITVPSEWKEKRVLLHFGAVDQIAHIYINRQKVLENKNGYLPFSVELTPYLNEKIELIVQVRDENRQIYPHGKQRKKRGGIWYTPISGIWQTVWMEAVPTEYIEAINYRTHFDDESITIEVRGGKKEKKVQIVFAGKTISESSFTDEITIRLPELHPWSPEDPALYQVHLQAGTDRVSSYFAMRKIDIEEQGAFPVLRLNNKPYFFHGVLDQGYFSDGIYLPANSKAYENDIIQMKEMGFNCLRKHIKIEPLVWYELCDRLGMAVFQDMVNNGSYSLLEDTVLPFLGKKHFDDHKKNPNREARTIFVEAMKGTMNHLSNHPCIVYWTIFNEGWGQFESDECYEIAKKTDPTRIIDATSGWYEQKQSDVISKHIYYRNIPDDSGKRPWVLSEFGGYGLKVEDHVFNLEKQFGYRIFPTKEALEDALLVLYEGEIIPKLENGLCACIYTQLSDVEDEINGLLTYDRKIIKVDKEKMKAISRQLRR